MSGELRLEGWGLGEMGNFVSSEFEIGDLSRR